MALPSRTAFMLLGVVLHAAYIASIFDIYFQSPVLTGLSPVSPPRGRPPARRVVLFVADGLRADRLFQPAGATEPGAGRPRAPFLRSIMEQHGAYGVSHTQVPTESRPGYVAITSGLYEDVSAVTKGWQANPVQFDSIFNRSAASWSLGSPSILSIFTEPVAHARQISYPPHMDDHGSNATLLDVWVFDQLHALLARAANGSDAQLAAQLQGDARLIFLLLPGLDANGHAYRPDSGEYYQNIRQVDAGLRDASAAVERYFGDDRTAFLFTSDHGMHSRGAHGDGHPENTRCPFVAWGAGIRGPEAVRAQLHETEDVWHDETHRAAMGWSPARERQWNAAMRLPQLRRRDIMQADIAPFMAALLGLAPPMNSEGVLPLAYMAEDGYRAEALLANVKQVLRQFNHKSHSKSRSTAFFRAYSPLHNRSAALAEMEASIAASRYAQAELQGKKLIGTLLQGLRYLHTYDWLLLMAVVAAGFLGWIALLLLSLARLWQGQPLRLPRVTVHSAMAAAVLAAVLASQALPARAYVYASFPCLFWGEVAADARTLLSLLRSADSGRQGWLPAVAAQLPTAAGVLLMSAAYDNRPLFSLVVAGVASRALLTATRRRLLPALQSHVSSTAVAYVASAAVLALFPLLPIDVHSTPLVLLGSCLLPLVLLQLLPRLVLAADSPLWRQLRSRALLCQAALLPLSGLLVASTQASLDAKRGLPLGNAAAAWALLFAAPALTALSPAQPLVRFLSAALGMATPFVLLSVGYEVLFYAALTAALLLWVHVHLQWRGHAGMLVASPSAAASASKPQAAAFVQESRLGFALLALLNVAFFGVGNIASISSFQISSCYRFSTAYAPFFMAALLLTKLLLPFTLVALAYWQLARCAALPASRPALFTLVHSELLCLLFFFRVRDYGSWLEIGNSISFYVINSVMLLVLPGLLAVARLVAGGG